MKASLKSNTSKALLVIALCVFLLVGVLLFQGGQSYLYARSRPPSLARASEPQSFLRQVSTVAALSTTTTTRTSQDGYNESTPSIQDSSSYLYSEHQSTSSPTTPLVLPTFHPSKDLFVRAVYFDNRPRNNHKNSSVFLVVAKKSITDKKLIVGCQIDGQVAQHFEVRLIDETPLFRAFYPRINHEEVFVECFDMPAKNGSTGHILFKKDEEAKVELAATERPLYIPRPRVEPMTEEGKKYGFTIAACAKVFGSNPPWLKEWLQYQKALGVQHVHLDAEDSFAKAGGLKKTFIQEAIKEGFLSIDIWKQYLSGSELWYHNQGLIYEDCVYRFLGVYDFLVLMDTDDFLTPRNPNEKQLYYYIDKYCRAETTGSCKFKWIEFYPDQFGLNRTIPIPDGNITRQLKNYSHYYQGNPKSLHRTNVIIDAATHYASKMLDGFRIQPVSLNVMYVAHIRRGNRLPTGKNLHMGLPHNGCFEHPLSKILLLYMLILFYYCTNC